MGATQLSKVGLPQEVNFNDLFLTDVTTDGALATNPASTNGGSWEGFSNGFELKMPEFDFGLGSSSGAGTEIVQRTETTKDKETGGSLGSTLQGVGAITGALASIYGIREQKKYQDEVLGMEKERVAKNEARRDTKQAEYEKVWGATDA